MSLSSNVPDIKWPLRKEQIDLDNLKKPKQDLISPLFQIANQEYAGNFL